MSTMYTAKIYLIKPLPKIINTAITVVFDDVEYIGKIIENGIELDTFPTWLANPILVSGRDSGGNYLIIESYDQEGHTIQVYETLVYQTYNEVVNARVGFDDTQYETLGQAIRTQISNLNTTIDNLQEVVDSKADYIPTVQNIENDVTSLQSNVTSIQSDVDDLSNVTSELSASINALSESKESITNKSTTISQDSTNVEYSTARAVYNYVNDIASAIEINNLKDGETSSLHQINATNIGPDSIAFGTSISGSKAFRLNYISTNAQDHTFETFNLSSVDGIEVGMEANIYINDGIKDTNYMMIGNVQAIDGNNLLITTSIVDTSIDIDNLVNSYIWFTGHSDIGDIIIGTGAVAEGYDTNATQIGSHSEGINTIALGKYSHAEGNGSVAGGYCSHAEGRNTITKGLYAHSGGDGSETSGDYSFAHGLSNKATNRCASAFNERTQANGRASSAFGYQTSANGTTSFSGGTNSQANHDSSFSFGIRTKTSRKNQVIFGADNQDNSDALFIIGDGVENNKHNAFEVLANDVKSNDISLEKTSNKVTSIDSASTDIQYPSAKAVFSEIEKNKKEIKSISNSSADLQTVLSTGPNSSGTYCRLMPYNDEKMYLWLDDKYLELIKVNGKWRMNSASSLFTFTSYESDETHYISEIANAFGILSPNNDGRVIVFFRCHGTRRADIIDDSTGETITETIPYYSIRAKVSNTDGTFDVSTPSTVMWSTELDEDVNKIHKLADGTYTCTYYTNGGTISVLEPWADTSSSYVYFSKIRHSDTGKNFVYLKDGNYPANDTCQDICKQQFIITNGTISSSGTMSYVINGYKRVDMDGVLNKNTRVGMVSFAKIKNSNNYLGIVESSVNLKASKPRPMCVQLFECRDISYSTLSPTTPKTILLPDEGESRGAPYITTLDDGRIAISFMSSQEFTGNKNEVSSFNKVWSVYVSKIPVTAGMLERGLLDDNLFVKLDFLEFSESQWGRWGSISNIDGKLYKTFTYGYNDNNGVAHRYGNLVIYNTTFVN